LHIITAISLLPRRLPLLFFPSSTSLLLRLAWRCYRPSHVHASVRILRLLFSWFQDLHTKKRRHLVYRTLEIDQRKNAPGRNIAESHPRSSSHQHCRTRHSNSVQKIVLPNVSWQRTRNHPRRPRIDNPKKRLSCGVSILKTRVIATMRIKAVQRTYNAGLCRSVRPPLLDQRHTNAAPISDIATTVWCRWPFKIRRKLANSPDVLGRSSPCHAFAGSAIPRPAQK
jgi:hypothetical protein